MNKPQTSRSKITLKQIMFKIARVKASDQDWILQQLTPHQRNTLNEHHGLKLLQDAQRFRTLNASDAAPPLQNNPEPLPGFCQALAMKAPLYVAIIIEQGAYSWQTLFLKQFDETGIINDLLNNQVLDLKITVKETVFNEWKRSNCFEQLLDDHHG